LSNQWLSCAKWEPIHGFDVTRDWHSTKGQAEGVCKLLKRHGLGGEGYYFPIKTWVEYEPSEDQILPDCDEGFDSEDEAQNALDWYSTTNEVGGLCVVSCNDKWFACFGSDYVGGVPDEALDITR